VSAERALPLLGQLRWDRRVTLWVNYRTARRWAKAVQIPRLACSRSSAF